MKKRLLAAAAVTAALVSAPTAHAYTAEEIEFFYDLRSVGVVNRDGASGLINTGWAVCSLLAQGYSRPWVAEQIYETSQASNGAAGVSYSLAQAMVFYAEADLCPEV